MIRNSNEFFGGLSFKRRGCCEPFFQAARKLVLPQLVMFSLAIVFSQTMVRAQSPAANFSTVVDVDSPANSIGSDQSIGSDVQLNLFAGGTIGPFFSAGAADGSSSNVEVNVFGGTTGAGNFFFEPRFTAHSGATINVFGGQFFGDVFQESILLESGSTANIFGGNFVGDVTFNSGSNAFISGGNFERTVNVNPESNTNISGGTFDQLLLFSGAPVDITGGSFNSLSTSSQTTVNISAGTINETIVAFGDFNLLGAEFFLDGVLIDLELGETLVVDQRDVTLSGLYADGSPFELTPVVGVFGDNIAGTDSFFDGSTLRIQRVAAVANVLVGDVNLDGAVNFGDIAPLVAVLANGDFQAEADTNFDESVNLLDVAPFVAILSQQ